MQCTPRIFVFEESIAKILLGISSATVIEDSFRMFCFYEQCIEALKEAGNDILLFNPIPFNKGYFACENELYPHIDEEKLIHNIQKFNPDIVIAFNNAMYSKILSIVDCPIVLWDSDMYPYWNQLSVIYANINRYVFFTSFKKNKELLNARFPNVRDEQIYYIPFGSDIQKEDIAQDKNISFSRLSHSALGFRYVSLLESTFCNLC